jgi:adenylate kinase
MKKEQLTIFTFFGPPGCGKGTLANKLAERLGFEVLSTGNLCRNHIAQCSDFGKTLNEYLKRGNLVPDALILEMVADWLKPLVDKRLSVVLDGFPRTEGQAAGFLDYFKSNVKGYQFRVILVNLPDDEIVKRISKRLVCENKACQKPFSTLLQVVDKCDICGSSLTKRDDDREEVVRDRLMVYATYRDPLLDFYRSAGQKIEELNIVGMSPEDVYSTFVAKI